MIAILNICNAGDSFISTSQIYGGSINLFSYTLKRLGIECIYLKQDATDEEILNAFKTNTKAVFGETLSNPLREAEAMLSSLWTLWSLLQMKSMLLIFV